MSKYIGCDPPSSQTVFLIEACKVCWPVRGHKVGVRARATVFQSTTLEEKKEDEDNGKKCCLQLWRYYKYRAYSTLSQLQDKEPYRQSASLCHHEGQYKVETATSFSLQHSWCYSYFSQDFFFFRVSFVLNIRSTRQHVTHLARCGVVPG